MFDQLQVDDRFAGHQKKEEQLSPHRLYWRTGQPGLLLARFSGYSK